MRQGPNGPYEETGGIHGGARCATCGGDHRTPLEKERDALRIENAELRGGLLPSNDLMRSLKDEYERRMEDARRENAALLAENGRLRAFLGDASPKSKKAYDDMQAKLAWATAWKDALYEVVDTWGPGALKTVADFRAEVERRAMLKVHESRGETP